MIIFCLFVLSSCIERQVEFERSKWNSSVDGFYEFREVMVNDLIERHLKKGMTYQEITNLLGKPENFANLKTSTLGYTLMEDYGWDIDPVETKHLYIELSTDSLVQEFKVEHWKK